MTKSASLPVCHSAKHFDTPAEKNAGRVAEWQTSIRLRSALLAYIDNYAREEGYPPTYRDIAEQFNRSLSNVAYHLAALRAQGRLTAEPHRPRTLRVKNP